MSPLIPRWLARILEKVRQSVSFWLSLKARWTQFFMREWFSTLCWIFLILKRVGTYCFILEWMDSLFWLVILLKLVDFTISFLSLTIIFFLKFRLLVNRVLFMHLGQHIPINITIPPWLLRILEILKNKKVRQSAFMVLLSRHVLWFIVWILGWFVALFWLMIIDKLLEFTTSFLIKFLTRFLTFTKGLIRVALYILFLFCQ